MPVVLEYQIEGDRWSNPIVVTAAEEEGFRLDAPTERDADFYVVVEYPETTTVEIGLLSDGDDDPRMIIRSYEGHFVVLQCHDTENEVREVRLTYRTLPDWELTLCPVCGTDLHPLLLATHLQDEFQRWFFHFDKKAGFMASAYAMLEEAAARVEFTAEWQADALIGAMDVIEGMKEEANTAKRMAVYN